MKTIYVEDLGKNQVIESQTFAIFESKRAEDKNGRPYYSLLVGDKTGRLSAKIWSDSLQNVDKPTLKPGKLAAISAKVDEYKGALQLNIMEMREVDETEVEDFIESSVYDPEEMMKELLKEIESIENKNIKKVLKNIFKDKEFASKFKFWPAANSIHHGFRSGLLQHVLEMLEIAKSMRKYYPDLNFDVLTAGIIMHDSGKTEEMSGGLSSNYTKIGSLIGHITIAAIRFYEAGKDILDEDDLYHIIHLILSHHGLNEYGSPVVPSTPEAMALYHIDGVSSKTRGALKVISDMSKDEEFSRPSFYHEGARFWSGHNLNLDQDQNNNDVKDSEESNPDQIALV